MCLRPLGLAKGMLRTRHNLAFLFWRVPAFSLAGEEDAPHTSKPCFFFLACASALLQWRKGCSAHVKTLFFLFGVCLRPLVLAKWLPHTRHNLAFSFWRVPVPSWAGERSAPHTSFPCFFFLACASALLCWRNGCPAHVTILLFLFDVCQCSLVLAKWLLRTRQNLAFSFWRVPPPSLAGERDAPHTSFSLLFLFGVYLRPLVLAKWLPRTRHFPCFFFLACAGVLLCWRKGCSAHVTILLFLFGVCLRPLTTATWLFRTRHNLAFPFWRVPPPSWAGERDAPHTSFYSFLENIPYQLINHLRIHRIIK